MKEIKLPVTVQSQFQQEKMNVQNAFKEMFRLNKMNSFASIYTIPSEQIFREVPGRQTIGFKIKNEHGELIQVFLKRHWVACSLTKHAKSAAIKETFSEWKNLLTMFEKNIPAPVLLAYGTAYSEGNSLGFVMTAKVDGQQADHFIEKYFMGKLTLGNIAKKRKLLRNIAETAKYFHEKGYNHRDFYLCHFFIAEQANSTFKVSLIDLQRVQHRTSFRKRWIVKDLAQLNYSALKMTTKTERLRMLLVYLNKNKLSKSDKILTKSVLRKTKSLVKKEHVFIEKI